MLNIARNIYSAYNTTNQPHTELYEVEIVPIGDSVNEKKKLENTTKRFTNIKEHENIPLPGFTLFSVGRKNYGSAESWLIIDPRGFLVRLSSANLEMILHVTGITEGLIQEKCVWARDNTETKMILVPVSSEKYIEAVRNTELIEGKVDMKDVQIGDTVLLQNKLQGTYLGSMSLYGPLNDYSSQNRYCPQVFLRRGVIEIHPGKFHYQTNPKILKVVERAEIPMTREEAVKHVNDVISAGGSYFTSSSHIGGQNYGVRGEIKLASTYAAPKVAMSFLEIDHYEATALFYDGQTTTDFGMLMLEDNRGDRFLIDYPYNFNLTRSNISVNNFNICKVINPTLEKTEEIMLADNRASFMSMQGRNTLPVGALDKFTKFYKIVKHVKHDTYV